MTTNDLLEALARLRVETGSLACLGCGYEHNCSVRGCQILREAATQLEHFTAENRALRNVSASKPAKRSLNARVTYLREMVKELNAQREKAEAERDAAIADLKISSGCASCKYHCSDPIFCRDCNKKQNCKCMSCSLGLTNWKWHGLPEAPEEGE